jgi:hypothetical protein
MRALFELDVRYALNQLRALLHSPGRLAIWVPYLVLGLGLGGWRLATPQAVSGVAAVGGGGYFASLCGGAFVAALGFALARHAAGRIQAFRCNAEALLCIDAGISTGVLAGWLQGRKLTGAMLRWGTTLLLYAGVFAPAGAEPPAVARTLAACIVVALTLAALEIPAFLAGRRRFGSMLVVAGWALCICGCVQALAGVAGLAGDPETAARIIAASGFDSGAAVRAVLDGKAAFLAFAALPLLPTAALALMGRNAVSELFEGTIHRPVKFTRARVREQSFAASQRAAQPPSGLGVLLWKDYLALKRNGGLPRMAGAFFAWGAFGAVIAAALSNGGNQDVALGLIAIAILIVALVPVAFTSGISDDLGNPLWWLPPGSMVRRLSAWTMTRAWPGGLALSGFPIALGIASGHPAMALLGPPGALLLWWSMNALSLALYAAFPGPFDLRGPQGLVRMVAGVAYLYPPLIACNAQLDNPLAGASAAALILGLQGYLALFFAARRFGRGGVAIVREQNRG